MPPRYLVVKPDELALSILPGQAVLIELRGFEKEAGLTPGLGVKIELTPTEARRFAIALSNKADEAEAGLPRA